MNKFLNLVVAFLITITTFAQAPEKMSYQAVVRDTGDTIVTNQAVGMQISVLQTTATGTAVYVETQTPTTNANGLVSIEIGMGSVVSGDFSIIDWSAGPYFIKTETDPTGGTNYTITGTSELLSVPYALHAKTTRIPISDVQTDLVLRNVNQSWVNGPTFNTINGFTAGSLVKISYLVPCRNVDSNWGGLYIEPQISFDNGSTWNSLGSSGYDGGVMISNGAAIGSYTNTLLISPEQTADFSVRLRFMYKSYSGTAIINGQNDVNNISGTASLMSGENGLQHYTKVIVEEIFQ